MFSQLQFYFKHSLNDLRVNGQRTLFAILAVAAGVAAIVSLQTVAVLINDTLTINIQEQHRGDIQLFPPFVFDDENEDNVREGQPGDNPVVERAVEQGYLFKDTSPSPLGNNTQAYFTPQGIQVIQTWLDENYPGSEVTYRALAADFLAIFTGTGNGTVVNLVDSDTQASQILPFFIPVAEYPFYDTLETIDGIPITELMTQRTDVFISRNLADDLDASVGDLIRVRGSEADFTIKGIIPAEVAAREPNIGILGAIFGFYYLDESAMELFEIEMPQADVLFVRLANPEQVDTVAQRISSAFSFTYGTTTTDVREQNEQIADVLDTLVTTLGLLSMLIGSIGIINTMQVVVRRRTLEVAVLKTVGMQANQVTLLFLTEAFIMGILGSIVGVFLGWAATFIIKGAAAAFTGQELEFRIALEPVFNGLFIGTLVTTVFGFIPTLSAGQVRPGIVLRPAQTVIPRAGIIRNILAMIFVIVALSLITETILGEGLAVAFQIVGGAFAAAGVIFVILLFIIWLIGRLMPSFGIVDLKLSLRQMLSTRGRGAITLLALVVGIFALSTITMFTETFRNLLDFAIAENSRGNVLINASPANIGQIEDAIESVDAVNSYWVDRNYEVTFISVEKGDTGETIFANVIDLQVRNELSDAGGFVEDMSETLNTIGARTPDQIEDKEFFAGRSLTPEDENQPYIILQQSQTIEAAGFEPGDKLNFELTGGLLQRDITLTLEIIGIEAEPETSGIINFGDGFSSSNYALMSVFPTGRQPNIVTVQVDIPGENVSELRQAVSDIPGALVLELELLVNFIQALVDQFRAFPTLVAALGLVVGGIIIANSVALATIERRSEIAIMKAIGLQRERVLAMLLLENAILGFVGGLFGVGLGLIALYALSITSEIPTDTIPIGTGALLIGLCIVVAMIAAVTTAWGASSEKPLNVLRYE